MKTGVCVPSVEHKEEDGELTGPKQMYLYNYTFEPWLESEVGWDT
jgi:hypothetical protein